MSSANPALRAESVAETVAASSSFAQTLRWIGALGVIVIAVMRCLIVFSPQVAFDGDPAVDATPFVGLGPAGSMLLDVLLLGACALALIGEWLCGRGLMWIVLGLALLPMPIVIWHGSYDAGNMWMGSTWVAAAVACSTIAHLARDRNLQILIIAILLAAVIPVLARGIVQVTYEHAQTLDHFEKTKDAFLRDRGWEPGSSSAQIFERRLRQPQPLGWFATSNIFASLAGFGLVMWIGLSIAAMRAKLESGWAGAMALCALIAAVILWMTGSKGAALAIFAGLMLLVLFGISALARHLVQHAGAIVMLFIFLALMGVVIRGTLVPEEFLGDKSLLYRWHYMVSSAAIVAENPVLGVGPNGYQEAYTTHRLPRNPEEVTSAHSAFIDWICTLGVLGAAWVAMALLMLWRGGCSVGRSMNPGDHQVARRSASCVQRGASSHHLYVIAFMALIAMVPALAIEWPALTGVSLLGRAIAFLAFIAVAALAMEIMQRSPSSIIQISLLGGTTMLMMHAQIEMTFTQPGAVVWAMCVLGVVGGGDERLKISRANFPRRRGVVVASVILLAAGWIALTGFVPALQQQQAMMNAAKLLHPLQHDPNNVELMLKQRRAAADELVAAYEIWPSNLHPLEAAAMQLLHASSQPDGPQPIGLLMQARDLLRRAMQDHSASSSLAMAISVNMRLALLTDDESSWQEAIRDAEELTRRDPHGISSWRRYGDVLWAAGLKQPAQDAYRRALECDANFELDEMKRLPDRDRERIEQRLAE